MDGRWTVSFDGGTHEIRADVSLWTGRVHVYLDDTLIETRTVQGVGGDIDAFERYGHSFVLRFEGGAHRPGQGYFGRLVLLLDGAAVGSPPMAPLRPLQSTRPVVNFLDETDVRETSEVVGTEYITLDNTFGEADLSMEKVLSRETTNEFSVETSGEAKASLVADFFPVVKAELGMQLSHKTGQTAGQKVTESQTFRMTAKAKERVTYRVVWKRTVRTGICQYWINGDRVSVTYRLTYGLSSEVRAEKPTSTGSGS
jgi:hypothetical protein